MDVPGRRLGSDAWKKYELAKIDRMIGMFLPRFNLHKMKCA